MHATTPQRPSEHTASSYSPHERKGNASTPCVYRYITHHVRRPRAGAPLHCVPEQRPGRGRGGDRAAKDREASYGNEQRPGTCAPLPLPSTSPALHADSPHATTRCLPPTTPRLARAHSSLPSSPSMPRPGRTS